MRSERRALVRASIMSGARLSLKRSEPAARPPLSHDELEAIYRTYGFLIHRRCRAVLRDEAAAQDAFQDVFVNLIRYGAGFRDAQSKHGWLYRVADRCCFAHLARRKNPPAPISDALPAPHEDLEVRQSVLSALDRMDPDDQTLAVMAFVEGRTQGEISRALGWSRQTINKRVQRLRTHAARLLEDLA